VSRVAIAVFAFLAGAATALVALGVAFRATPGVIMADDMVSALAVTAARPLSQFASGSVVYVKSAVGPMLLETLRRGHPTLILRPYSERPDDACSAGDPPAAPCERADFLKLEVLSPVTPRTLLVAVGTSRAFGQVLLVRVFGHWHVLSERSYAV